MSVNEAVLVFCNGCDKLLPNVISTLCRHDQSCDFHDMTGCTHGGYCYRPADAEEAS